MNPASILIHLSISSDFDTIHQAVSEIFDVAKEKILVGIYAWDSFKKGILFVVDIKFYDNPFPTTLDISLVEAIPNLPQIDEPTEYCNITSKLCKKLLCTALIGDFDEPANPYRFILINSNSPYQKVAVDDEFNILEYGNVYVPK